MMKKLLVVIFFILIAVRVVHLGADLPVARTEIMQNVGEFYYDEGWWSLGVRDLLLFDDANHSDFNTIPLCPVAAFFYYIFFKIFGINLISLKLIGLFASLLSLYLFFQISGKDDSNKRLLAISLFGFNSLFIIYSRTSLLEIICLPLLLTAMGAHIKKRHFIAGVLVGLAVLTKVHTIFFLLVLLIFPRRLKVLLGFLIIFIPWLAIVMNQPILSHYQSSRWFTAGRPLVNVAKSLFIGLVYRDTLFRNNPLFFIFSLIALPGLYNRKDHVSRLFFFWAILGGIFLGIFPFQPARYFILLLPPLSYALVNSEGRGNRWLVIILAVVASSQTVFGVLRPIADNFHGPMATFPALEEYKLTVELPRFLKTHDLSIYPEFFARMILYVIFSGISLLLGLIFGFLFWKKFKWKKQMIPLILMVDLFLNSWLLTPHYSFLKFGRRIAKDVQGEVAPAGTFSVMNRLDYDNLPVLKRDMSNPDLYPKYALLISHHPLMGRFREEKFFKEFRPVVLYSLFNNRYQVTLYEKIENHSRIP